MAALVENKTAEADSLSRWNDVQKKIITFVLLFWLVFMVFGANYLSEIAEKQREVVENSRNPIEEAARLLMLFDAHYVHVNEFLPATVKDNLRLDKITLDTGSLANPLNVTVYTGEEVAGPETPDGKYRYQLTLDRVLDANLAHNLISISYMLQVAKIRDIYLADNRDVLTHFSREGEKSSPVLFAPKPLTDGSRWHHYFECAAFHQHQQLCDSEYPYVVGNPSTDLITGRRILSIAAPFKLPVDQGGAYGLKAIDLDFEGAFTHLLAPNFQLASLLASTDITTEACDSWRCISDLAFITPRGREFFVHWHMSPEALVSAIILNLEFWLIVLLGWLALPVVQRKVILLLQHHYLQDQLTGLHRRDFLSEERLYQHSYLLLLDIDNFKSFNDIYGHNVGDMVLVQLAAHLKKHIRSSDLALRWGGEEFVVLYRKVEPDALIETILKRLLKDPLHLEDLKLDITFSGGLIPIGGSKSMTQLFEEADQLLYHVKKHGKNNIAMPHQTEGMDPTLIMRRSTRYC